MTATFTAMVSGGFDLNMLVLDFPRTDRCSDADWWSTVNAFEAALKTNKAQGRDRRLAAGEPARGARGGAAPARHRAAPRHCRGDGCGGGGGVHRRGVAQPVSAPPGRGSALPQPVDTAAPQLPRARLQRTL